MFRKYKYAEQNLLVLTEDLELSLSLHGVALTKWLQNGKKIKFIF